MVAREQLDQELRKGIAYALEGRLAPHYARHMVQDCHYRTPHMLAAALRASSRASLGERDGPTGNWLDLGAGTGLLGQAIAEQNLALPLVALDISAPMLAQIDCPLYTERVMADASLPLPFADGAFSGALAAGLFEHIAEPLIVLQNVARVLARGGRFLLTFPPNEAGRTELFDVEQGLVSHDVKRMRDALEDCRMSVVCELEYPAYRNGSKGWVIHHLASCRRA